MFNSLLRNFCIFAAASCCVLFSISAAFAVNDNEIWHKVDDTRLRQTAVNRQGVPKNYKVFSLNRSALRSLLSTAPEEFSRTGAVQPVILSLPMPDGSLGRFRIEHSLVVEPGLLKKYPELGETYRGQGIDDPSSTVRFDFLPKGFHAMVLSTKGTVMVDPYSEGDTSNYVTYFKDELERMSSFECDFDDNQAIESVSTPQVTDLAAYLPSSLPSTPAISSGTQLRTYRLALAADNEYAVAVGGNTVAGTLAAQVLIMNRVNGVYERDLAIHMNIIANNNLIVYAGDNMCAGVACTNANDPYTNNDGSTMLGQNQTNVDAVIGTANYDIGHVFSTGGGGVANLRVPCGSSKARGVTGLGNPVGDAFAIDYVAHEMGHEWGANHTFNSTVSNCGGGNRSSSAAFETGSGITIMAYAGICGNQDLALHSIDTFHVRSLEEIISYSQTGNGNSCAVTTASGNTPPSVSVGSTLTIPKLTPFALIATGGDVDGDSVTYDWQEYDLGPATTTVPNTDSDGVARPILRPYLPTSTDGGTTGSRFFPSLQYILNNANVPPSTFDCGRSTPCLTGELLPSITRTMTFQVIARDNHALAGGINTATQTVNINANAGPFAVTSPNTNVSWPANSQQTVTWNVANTDTVLGTNKVDIMLSINGGQTVPITLVADTANDGSQTVTIPDFQTSQARILVKAAGGTSYFDISDVNFSITPGGAVAPRSRADFDADGKTDVSVFRPSTGDWYVARSGGGGILFQNWGIATDVVAPGDYDGDGKADLTIFRPADGNWWVIKSGTSTIETVQFGAAGDIPVAGDYDGDGKTDKAIFRPSTGEWYIAETTAGSRVFTYGAATDKPVPADYDNDGKTDLAVFRPSTGDWYIAGSTSGSRLVNWGTATDKPVPADYDGDGKDDVAIFRPSTGEWYVIRSSNGAVQVVNWGVSTDTPVPGDYDGDGKDDFAIFRPSTGNWFIVGSTSGVQNIQWGANGDTPVPSKYIP